MPYPRKELLERSVSFLWDRMPFAPGRAASTRIIFFGFLMLAWMPSGLDTTDALAMPSFDHKEVDASDEASKEDEALKEDGDEDRYRQLREQMVNRQIIARGVENRPTLGAMRSVPRHKFVRPAEQRQAYMDSPLPIGYGQTISQPFIVAYMTQLIDPEPGMKVLEIGTGSGYQAAVLAEITDQVFTIEIVEELGDWGEQNLQSAGYDKVQVKRADGYHGWAEHAPFDAIVVTAAADHIPPPLVEQLRDGGRMVIPVGSPFRTQNLMLVEKRGEDIRTRNLMPVRFVPFTREEE